jgi:hypothetical protein
MEAFDELKFRARIVAGVMEALGPEFERAGEQLAAYVLEAQRTFHESISTKGLTSNEDWQRHLNHVYETGHRAISATISETLGLLKAARRGSE